MCVSSVLKKEVRSVRGMHTHLIICMIHSVYILDRIVAPGDTSWSLTVSNQYINAADKTMKRYVRRLTDFNSIIGSIVRYVVLTD